MKDWAEIKLGNACFIKKGQQFNSIDLEVTGEYPCINGGIMPSGFSDKWNTEANTITISEGGNSCGFVNFLKTRFWSGGHCYSLMQLKNSITTEFLFYALKSRESLLMDLRVGSGLPNIQRKAIKGFEFIYPKEKLEQTTIAEILIKVDKAITQSETVIAKYNRIKTGFMQDLLTKGIDKSGYIRSEGTHPFKDSFLGRIPVEWNVVPLKDCIELHNFLRKPISSKERSKMIGIFPYYGATGIIDTIDAYRVEGEFVLIGEDGDHFLKWRNQEQTILTSGKFNVNNHAHIVKGTNKCLTKWIHYFFSHRDITFYLTRQGAGRFKLNKKSLLNLPILLPKETAEQELIVEKIEKINLGIRQQTLEKEKLQSLKKGLMQDLLSGKVRVKGLIKENVATEAEVV